jgi:sporulation protein YlmC with PRC-barrel domain
MRTAGLTKEVIEMSPPPRIVKRAGAYASAALLLAAMAYSADANERAATPLSAEQLYSGLRASTLLGKQISDQAGRYFGTLRNLILDQRGHLGSVVIEAPGQDFSSIMTYRVPWRAVHVRRFGKRMWIGKAQARATPSQTYAPLPDQGSQFTARQVIGDYARLQAGQSYGYVTDVVFSRQGTMTAILVLRTVSLGGGTFAFRFPGTIGRWNPATSYYGLPYVTPAEANAAATPVNLHSFRLPGEG